MLCMRATLVFGTFLHSVCSMGRSQYAQWHAAILRLVVGCALALAEGWAYDELLITAIRVRQWTYTQCPADKFRIPSRIFAPTKFGCGLRERRVIVLVGYRSATRAQKEFRAIWRRLNHDVPGAR